MKRSFVVVALSLFVALAAAAPVLAHGHRGQGDMEFTVGWASEPALVGQPNAVQLFLVHDGKNVAGAENTLKVTVSIGGKSTDPMKLRTVFDSPGEYRADIIPTVVGGYTFHFTGTVDGEKVDQSFVSPKDGFDEVEGTSDIAFPKAAPTTTELAEKLAVAEKDLADAKDSASTARTFAIAGIGLAVVAMGVGVRKRSAA